MTITLDFLAQQQDRILAQLAELRDDMHVLTAIVQRLDGGTAGLVNELRAEHARHERLAQRVRRIEDAAADAATRPE